MTNVSYLIKRKYFDARIGMMVIAPLLAISNFVFLAYNFTELKNYMSLESFSIIFVVSFLAIIIIIGSMFRKVQTPTDIKLHYEKNIEQARTMVVLLNAIKSISDEKNIDDRIQYLQSIIDENIPKN